MSCNRVWINKSHTHSSTPPAVYCFPLLIGSEFQDNLILLYKNAALLSVHSESPGELCTEFLNFQLMISTCDFCLLISVQKLQGIFVWTATTKYYNLLVKWTVTSQFQKLWSPTSGQCWFSVWREYFWCI